MNSGSHDFLISYQARCCHYSTVTSVFGDPFTRENLGDLGTETSVLPTSQTDRMAAPCSYVLIMFACEVAPENRLTSYYFSLHEIMLSPAGRGAPSRAQEWTPVPHWEMDYPRGHMQTKQKISLGRNVLVESNRIREPRRTALVCGLQSQVLW